MALPFTDAQRDAIRARLMESAERHAIADGVKKTSLDALTSEAGISKSSFYKFFVSKEQLFLEVAGRWETLIIDAAMRALHASRATSDKQRAADMVLCAFTSIHKLGIARFLVEDVPLLIQEIPEQAARAHSLSSADLIFDALQKARIRFTQSDEIVRSVIQLMYLSTLNMRDVGAGFLPALHVLVSGACEKLVA